MAWGHPFSSLPCTQAILKAGGQLDEQSERERLRKVLKRMGKLKCMKEVSGRSLLGLHLHALSGSGVSGLKCASVTRNGLSLGITLARGRHLSLSDGERIWLHPLRFLPRPVLCLPPWRRVPPPCFSSFRMRKNCKDCFCCWNPIGLLTDVLYAFCLPAFPGLHRQLHDHHGIPLPCPEVREGCC